MHVVSHVLAAVECRVAYSTTHAGEIDTSLVCLQVLMVHCSYGTTAKASPHAPTA
jgi:hypothetical protein